MQALRLPLWGEVITEQVAKHTARTYTVPIGDNKGKGPALYISGTDFVNPRLSTWCAAWCVPPLPKKVVEKEKNMATDEKEKKKKKADDATATHMLDYESFSVNIGDMTFHYMAPYLRDNDQGSQQDVYDRKCYRVRTSWDDGVVEKSTTKPGKLTSFVAM